MLGFSGAPEAGDRVAVVEYEARAREITEYRERQRREKLGRARPVGAHLAHRHDEPTSRRTGRKEMPLVVKGDVQGSVEAITAALEKLGNEEVVARVIHGGVGGVTESDVTLAAASKAVIIGFNVRAHKEARELAEEQGIEIRYYNIIYNLVDDVKAAMSGMLAPTLRETMLGNAQILEVFNISKVGKVAGCRVTDGVVQRGAHVRLIRDNVVVHEGKLSTLKRFKDEVAVVQAGQECGMAFENYQDMRSRRRHRVLQRRGDPPHAVIAAPRPGDGAARRTREGESRLLRARLSRMSDERAPRSCISGRPCPARSSNTPAPRTASSASPRRSVTPSPTFSQRGEIADPALDRRGSPFPPCACRTISNTPPSR